MLIVKREKGKEVKDRQRGRNNEVKGCREGRGIKERRNRKYGWREVKEMVRTYAV